MNAVRHTIGPWAIEHVLGPADLVIVPVGRPKTKSNCIAICAPDRGIDVTELRANACLISVAPELLEVLREMTDGWEPAAPSPYRPHWQHARNLIAKATRQ